jgi:hypothetical protein
MEVSALMPRLQGVKERSGPIDLILIIDISLPIMAGDMKKSH